MGFTFLKLILKLSEIVHFTLHFILAEYGPEYYINEVEK